MSDYPRPFGEYVLLERLGAGGMSEVDLGRKLLDESTFVRFVVIKRIKTDRSTDKAFVRMFKDEARITSHLHHENIGQVYDFGREGDEYFLALEYVPGVDVRYLINVLRERGQRVPIKVALRIIHDVCLGLDYAHRKRDTFGKPMEIVHRDVNPRNIMVSIRGDVKLIDFGVAKATDRLERTRTDHVKGKFSYMAPEQISGLAIDSRADLYAVGLTLHEFLAGHGPFYGLNQIQIMHRMVSGRIPDMPPVSELPDGAAMQRVHDKALARDPADRYQTAAELAAALKEVAEQVGGLPNNDQMAAFLNAVDPELTIRLESKMEAFAQIEITSTGEITNNVALDKVRALPPNPALEASMVGSTSDGSLTATRTSILAGSIMFVSMTSAITAAIVVALLGLALFVWFGTGPSDPVPQPQPPVPVQPTPDPVPVVQPPPPQPPDPQPEEPEPEPVAPDPEPERPDPVPQPPPQPEPEPEPEPQPEPEPEPEPVVPDPVPEPEPPPPPEPVAMAFAKVNSTERGRAVFVNGSQKGTTPATIKLPLGSYTVRVEGYPSKSLTLSTENERKTLVFQ